MLVQILQLQLNEKGTGDAIATNDAVDTTLGIDGTATLKVDATVVVTQVD